jgi:hypothetical protein
MDANSRKKPSKVEINDLIAEAVVNAEARRNPAGEVWSEEELAAKGSKVLWLGRRDILQSPPDSRE